MNPCNNYRALTVFDYFIKAVEVYGDPSQCCGDYGGENKGICMYMLLNKGANRGSFIWGPYVWFSLYDTMIPLDD
jgi:hypothetical protein